jgi:hypothetical protein
MCCRDFGFTYASGQVVWRLPVAMQILWSLLAIVLMIPTCGKFVTLLLDGFLS